MKEIVEMMAKSAAEAAGLDWNLMRQRCTKITDNEKSTRNWWLNNQRAALTAIEQAGFVVIPKEPTEAMGRVSGMKHRCGCGVRITQWAVNRWSAMIEAATSTPNSQPKGQKP